MNAHNAGPVAAALAIVAGVVVGQLLGPGSGALMLIVAFAMLVVLVMIAGSRSTGSSGLRRVGVGLCLCACGAAAMQRALDGLVHHSLANAVARGAAVELRGELVGDPAPSRFETTALVRVADARVSRGGWQSVGRLVVVHARGRVRGVLSALDAADRVHLLGDIAELRGFDQRMRWKHAVAAVDLYELSGVSDASAHWRFANWLRSIVQRGIDTMPQSDRGLLNGFLLGDTRAIDDATRSQYRAAGLSHLLAVSGANVAFVLSLAAPMLMRCRMGLRVTLGCCIVVLFAAMTRFEPSVLRASFMALVTLTAQLSGRSVSALRALCYAVGGLLLIDPFLVRSVGFQLSASACLGIALFATRLSLRVPGPPLMQQTVGVSVAAQVGVAPVLLATFGTVAWISPAANLFAVPLAEPITVFGFPLAVMASVWRPAAVLLRPVGWALHLISTIARTATNSPGWLGIAAFLAVLLAAVSSSAVRQAPGQQPGQQPGPQAGPANFEPVDSDP